MKGPLVKIKRAQNKVIWRASRFLPPRLQILKTIEGENSANRGSRRAAVFVHFDALGNISEYVEFYVRALAQEGFAIHFVSNSPRLKSEALQKIIPHCIRVCTRRNIGHDFGAYRDGILTIPDIENLDSLLIANDSVYGPLHPLSALLTIASPDVADVWGASDNWDKYYHLQSYFILFHRKALRSSSFHKFWTGYRCINDRNLVIKKGEMGLTQALLADGLNCRACFPYERLASAFMERLSKMGDADREHILPTHRAFLAHVADVIEGGGPLNPTHYFWDILIEDLHFPFIKRDLLQRNPVRIPGLIRWRDIIERQTDDLDLISKHLRLSARNHVP
jgi:lipopolysaccharide biosynthesis protein